MTFNNLKKIVVLTLIIALFTITAMARPHETIQPRIADKYKDIGQFPTKDWWLDYHLFGNYVWTYFNIGIWPGADSPWGAWPQQYPKYMDDLNQNEVLYEGYMIYANEKIMNGSLYAFAYEQGGDIDDLNDMGITFLSAQDSISQLDKLMGFSDYPSDAKDKLFVAATCRALQWNYPNVDDFQANIWTFHNYGTQDATFMVYFCFDWDIDWNTYERNDVEYIDSLWSSRMSNVDTGVSGGITFLSHEPRSMYATHWDMPFWLDPEFDINDPEDEYDYLFLPEIFSTDSTPRDYRVNYTAGMFTLAPGEQFDFEWAFSFGTSKSLYQTNAEALWETYNAGWKPPNPPPDAPYIILTPGDRKVNIRWTRNRSVNPKVLDDGSRDYTEYPDSSYRSSAESSVDPNTGLRDWDGYLLYRNLTGGGEISENAWHLIAELNSTYILNTYGSIPTNDLDSRYWTTTYWAEYTDDDPGLYNGFKYYYTVVSYDAAGAITNPTANAESIVLRWKAEGTADDVKVVPNPYRISNPQGFISGIQFIHLPSTCEIKIYSTGGDYITTLYHADGKGDHTWDLRNDNEQLVAPGVYFYVVDSDQGSQKGKFVIIH